MKKLCVLPILLAISYLSFSQSGDICNTYFPYEDGATFSYETYNKKDKLESSESYVVEQFEETDEGLEATVSSEIKDKKGKELGSGTFDVRCEGGVYYVRVDQMLDRETLEAFENTDIKVEGDFLPYPGEIAVGDVLEGGSTTITAETGGFNIMKMKVEVSDRKVEGREKVTTPAGTFDCLKISYTTSIDFLFNKEYQNIDWLAEEVGMVQSQTFKNNDKLVSTRKLVSYDK